MKIALTIDDPHLDDGPHLTAEQRDRRIRDALDAHGNLQAVLFVCGKRVPGRQGTRLLESWHESGHILGNHTFSHPNLDSGELTVEEYVRDIEACGRLLAPFESTHRLFRYPYLKGGNTAATRDTVKAYLARTGYRLGHVTIDASDWCIDAALCKRLAADSAADLAPYRTYYLEHMRERALYYDTLATELLGREVTHTILLHHNLLNALFLNSLLRHFSELGWQLVDAGDAYGDPIHECDPDIVPFGESIVWALARHSGRYEGRLRYPAEDAAYELPAMRERGLLVGRPISFFTYAKRGGTAY